MKSFSVRKLGVGEGFEEGHEGGLLFFGEIEAVASVFGDVGVEGGGAVDVLGVKLDHFFEGLEAAVVHVGGSEGDVT